MTIMWVVHFIAFLMLDGNASLFLLFQGNTQHLPEDVIHILDTSFTWIETASLDVMTTLTVQPTVYLPMDPIGVRQSQELDPQETERMALRAT